MGSLLMLRVGLTKFFDILLENHYILESFYKTFLLETLFRILPVRFFKLVH